ncbi:MAG TPA: twin-arginine translocation signal domain-containing protein [Sedimentisphaerales bacterium]|nr:twin-arginine translocation signal domain-containing protein [Sedimentisphaerales bacterium]
MRRRDFLKGAGTAGTAIVLGATGRATQAGGGKQSDRAGEYLRSMMPSRQQVDDFIQGRQGPEKLSCNQGWLFDGELGWILCDSVRPRSVDGSRGYYSYETDGARKVINGAGKPSRIHTYGNSFTHCDQVSDGETWQEYLAAHLQEPIRNYGVGGYSVYQAYRRMLKVEKDSPAEYVILNVWDDDHFRNLDSWRSIRFGRRTPCGFTLPYLRVNVKQNRCEQVENLCSNPEQVYRLCDEDFVLRKFEDDPVLKVVLATRGGEKVTPAVVKSISEAFGVFDEDILALKPADAIRKIHTEASLYATRNIITWTEQFVRKTGRKLMVILSFGRGNIANALKDMPRFDQSFVDWLKDKSYPVMDMRDFFVADFIQSRLDPNAYLNQYYIGHHNPAGNFFTAWALKKRWVDWLDPRPLPYRPEVSS